jgi:hypothetical protein
MQSIVSVVAVPPKFANLFSLAYILPLLLQCGWLDTQLVTFG